MVAFTLRNGDFSVAVRVPKLTAAVRATTAAQSLTRMPGQPVRWRQTVAFTGLPVISDTGALQPVSLTAPAPVLGAPAIAQVHALTAAGIDVPAPVLGSPALDAPPTVLSVALDTEADPPALSWEVNRTGTLYWVLSTSDATTAAQVIAGSGGGIVFAASVALDAAGDGTAAADLSGVTAGSYWLHAVLVDGAEESAVFTEPAEVDAPAAVAFGASPYDGWNATETSAADDIVAVAYDASMPDPNSGHGPRRFGFRLDNTFGKAPEIRVNTSPGNFPNTQPNEAFHLVWSADPDSDNWTDLSPGTLVSGQYRAMTPAAPLPAGPIHFQSQPCASVARMRGKVDAWIADPLTSPTPSAQAGYVIGAYAARTVFGVPVPAYDVRAFRVGTGPRTMVLTGCVHPDEGMAWWALETMVDDLLGESQRAQRMRDRWTIYVYPELNLQGAYRGVTRWDPSTANIDCNRTFGTATTKGEVATIHEAAWALDLSSVQVALDMHGAFPNRTPARTIFRNVDGPGENAVAAFDAAMATFGPYGTLDSTLTTTVRGHMFANFKTGPMVCGELEHALSRQTGVQAWRQFGLEVIGSIDAIQPSVWPDESAGETVIAAGDGALTVESVEDLSDLTVTAGDGVLTIGEAP